ncbi:hypothetical protein [Mycolicibacterium sp.]|uniref:hypothetical protein n=1 Tax=Mycolicibacterium sp. TaxID=2320850 RepID=UPI003D0D23B9
MTAEWYGVQIMDHIVKGFDDRDEAIKYLRERRAEDVHEGRDPCVWSIDGEAAGLPHFWNPT